MPERVTDEQARTFAAYHSDDSLPWYQADPSLLKQRGDDATEFPFDKERDEFIWLRDLALDLLACRAERDEWEKVALDYPALSIRYQQVKAERDAAVARAERAEQERDALTIVMGAAKCWRDADLRDADFILHRGVRSDVASDALRNAAHGLRIAIDEARLLRAEADRG